MSKFETRGEKRADGRRKIAFAQLVPEMVPGALYVIEVNDEGVIRLKPAKVVVGVKEK